VDDFGDGFALKVETDERIDPHRVIGYMHTAMSALVEALERAPESAALTLSILPRSEREQVLQLFNSTQAVYPAERLIHELFQEQVARTPDAIAVLYGEQKLTYRQLNVRANVMARYIQDRGAEPGDYIPILMSRSLQFLVAQLAVLKCGCVYVPIDPEMPIERQTYMMGDCGARSVLAEPQMYAALHLKSIPWIDTDEITSEEEGPNTENLNLPLPASTPAYVMYTSGSTGAPKGVVVPHHAVNRLVINNGYADIGPGDCVAHCSNPAFDASTFEIWGALLNGARLCIYPKSLVMEPVKFAGALGVDAVTVLWLTVRLFKQYAENLRRVLPRLRYLLVGGEAVESDTMRTVLSTESPGRLLNGYGPTECTTFATTYVMSRSALGEGIVPIGRPISNTQIYILDSRMQPVPIGVAGEIHIGGAGVALGYLNRAELTARQFVADLFSPDPGARVYRSGDLGRWRADGTIEYLGRNDHQVKIRGFRIETGEIEAQLKCHKKVLEAVVLACDIESEKRLVAYITLRDPVNVADLRAHLKLSLPDYMVPSAFVTLARLPLNSNGKLDRPALPHPQLDSYATEQYEAPQGKHEEILAEIWRQILQLDRIGRQDNFFELGGHSLLIVQMMELLRRRGLSTNLRGVYESSTLAALAGRLAEDSIEELPVPPSLIPCGSEQITPQMLPLVNLQPGEIERIVQSVPGGAANIQDIYPLAPLQEGILFHHLLSEERAGTYVLAILLSLSSHQKLQELIAALQTVVDRHDVLRTAVLWEGLPKPVQVVQRRVTVPVQEVEAEPGKDPVSQLQERMTPRRQTLDLRQAPLLRLQTLVNEQGECHALLQVHLLVCDHESVGIIFEEVIAQLEGHALQLPEPVSYRNHVAQVLGSEGKQDVEKFFRGKLAGIEEPTAPFGLLDVHGDGSESREYHGSLDPQLAQQVRVQARRSNVSAATLFHAAWGLVVAHTSGRDDVVYGTVLLGRLQGSAGAQRILGLFLNTLPLRLRLTGLTASEFVERTHHELVELLSHDQASLSEAQRCSDISGSAPLFSALLNYRHTAPDRDAAWGGRDSGMRLCDVRDWTNYPLLLSVDDLGEGFGLTVQADRRIEPQRVMSYAVTAMQSLLAVLERAPQTPALTLSILPHNERRQTLPSVYSVQSVHPVEGLIHELFEEQAARIPDECAVLYGEQRLTYAELNSRANILAAHLLEHGVRPDTPVALVTGRSPEAIVGILAVLKAGAACVSLNPRDPAKRIASILHDTGACVVLTYSIAGESVPAIPENIPTIAIRQVYVSPEQPHNLSAKTLGLTPYHLAYVVYTSGSTGTPKGIAMTHAAMVNLVVWHSSTHPVGAGMRVLQYAPFNFDVAYQEIFSTLCTGATLVLMDESTRADPALLAKYISDWSIHRIFVPPVVLQSLAERCVLSGQSLRCLQDVFTSGEQLRITPAMVRFFAQAGGCRLHNQYGPAETHVISAATLPADYGSWPVRPGIGFPVTNTRLYVLNRSMQPVPVGVAGELYVGGMGIARGYLSSTQTAERFIAGSAAGVSGERLYKTGDRVRRLADGSLEFLGRADRQVKIRGYRVELGEIEAQLRRDPDVSEALVVTRFETGHPALVAYVRLRIPGSRQSDDLRNRLMDTLPDYMLPDVVLPVEHWPLTHHGKVDQDALPCPGVGAADLESAAPDGAVEQWLAAVWKQLLPVSRVSRNDSFFALGGNSLLAMRLVARVVGLSVANVYRRPTLRQMATMIDLPAALETVAGSVAPRITHLTYQQQRFWNTMKRANLTNSLRGHAIRLRGSLNLQALQRAVSGLVVRHGVLSSRIIVQDNLPMQQFDDPREWEVEMVQCTGGSTIELEEDARRLLRGLFGRQLDLAAGPIFDVTLLQLSEKDHILAVTWDHLINDGNSLVLLFRELWTLYRDAAHERPSSLAYALQYADYAEWQYGNRAGWLKSHGAYWDSRLRDAARIVLPFDTGLENVRQFTPALLELSFGETLSAELLEFARREWTTPGLVILALYASVASSWCAQKDLLVPFSVGGRRQPQDDNVLGLFSHAALLRIELNGVESFRQLLDIVAAEFLCASEHPDYGKAYAEAPLSLKGPEVSWLPWDAADLHGLTMGGAKDVEDLPFTSEPFEVPQGKLADRVTPASDWGLGVFIFRNTVRGIIGDVIFRADLYREQTIRRFGRDMRLLAAQVVNPDKSL
jgi:amino acid adenylation domain-containing protein